MSSGYFPFSRSSVEGKRLVEVVTTLREAIEEYSEYARELDVSEDAVSDGWALGQLSLAAKLVEDQLERKP